LLLPLMLLCRIPLYSIDRLEGQNVIICMSDSGLVSDRQMGSDR